MKKIIHVNQHNIRRNIKTQSTLPVLTCKTYKHNFKFDKIDINGPSSLIYRPNKPLNCGARVWIETTSKVVGIENGRKIEII